jgi:outer membrane protein TolC
MKTLLIILFIFPLIINAQSLDSLLAIAESQNLSILSQQALINASKEKVMQEGVLDNPTLSVSGQKDMLITSGRQMIPWFGTLKAMKNVAKAESEIPNSELKVIKNELSFQIKKYYFELTKIHQDIFWMNKNIEYLKKMEELLLEQYQSNKTSMTEIIRLQMQIKQEESKLITMQEMITPITFQINQLLNRNLTTEIILKDTVFIKEPLMFSFDSLWSKNPVFEVFEKEKQMLEQQQKLVDYERKPQFMAGFDVGYITIPMLETEHGGREYETMNLLMPMIGATIPIYSKKKNEARINELKWKNEAIEKESLQMQKEFEAMIMEIVWRKNDAMRRLNLYEYQLKQVDTLIALMLSEYTSGMKNFSDILQMYVMQTMYQTEKNKAMYDYKLAIAELERIEGRN